MYIASQGVTNYQLLATGVNTDFLHFESNFARTPLRDNLRRTSSAMVPQVLLVCTYSSFTHGGVFGDCLVVLFQLNFDFDDFSFEFGDGARHDL